MSEFVGCFRPIRVTYLADCSVIWRNGVNCIGPSISSVKTLFPAVHCVYHNAIFIVIFSLTLDYCKRVIWLIHRPGILTGRNSHWTCRVHEDVNINFIDINVDRVLYFLNKCKYGASLRPVGTPSDFLKQLRYQLSVNSTSGCSFPPFDWQGPDSYVIEVC